MKVLLRSVAYCSPPTTLESSRRTTTPYLPTYEIHWCILWSVYSLFAVLTNGSTYLLRSYRRRSRLHLLPTNHNNNTQRVDNTTRLLIGLGICILLPYPIERANITPLTAHAFAYAVRHRRRVYYYETPSLDQPSSLNHRLYYESSSCLDYSLPP
jgi:hypothetical protein